MVIRKSKKYLMLPENYGENSRHFHKCQLIPILSWKGNPYFRMNGIYPAEIFDAPCCNLAGCRHLKWTAYTYLVDLPSRMNSNKLKFSADTQGIRRMKNGPQRSLPLEILTENDWEKHATEKGILKISQITGGCTAKL